MEGRRHYIVPDCQIRPGDPTDHLDWIAKDIVRRKPDVIVCIGDFFDLPSLSRHAAPGSMEKENSRLLLDIRAGQDALHRLTAPIHAEVARCKRRRIKRWNPRLVVTEGNHEERANAFMRANPVLEGVVGTHLCDFEAFGFERHPFKVPVEIDGIWYAHYWQAQHSDRPIGGTIDNRLNKLGFSFVAGHEQGKRYSDRPLPNGKTLHGIVCGSCYLVAEDYRGPQARHEWRGTVVLHDVVNGDCDPMFLTLRYLCEEYTGERLPDYMAKRYPDRDWSHLARRAA
jgi:hypothetical protein